MKITKLTPEQEIELIEFRERWRGIGLSTERVDKDATRAVIADFYRRIGEKEPKVFFFSSPFIANLAINALQKLELIKEDQLRGQLGGQLWDQLGDQLGGQLWDQLRDQLGGQLWDQLRDQLWGQLRDQLWDQLGGQLKAKYIYTNLWGALDSYWTSFYLFCQKIGVNYTQEQSTLLGQWAKLSQSCFWWWPYKNAVIVSDRPSKISFDQSQRLHNETGPAVQFIDGYSLYVWRGTRVQKEWIEDKDALMPETALTWENIEQRRAACEIMGWGNVLKALNARIIHKDPDPSIGVLLEADIPDSGTERFLQVRCGTGREFVIPVPREIETARQGNAWTYGLDPHQLNPEVRT